MPNQKIRYISATLQTTSIHPSAIISPAAVIGQNVKIGPFTVIDGPASIGDDVNIDGHVLIRGRCTIGARSQIGWGSVIGADPQDLGFDPQTDSGVILGENNRLREYVTIHRATVSKANTIIGNDNFIMTGVHLGHDVVMGSHNILANNILVAGHVVFGDRCVVGGASVFHQFVRIGDYAMVQGMSGLSLDVPPYCLAYEINRLASLNAIGLKRGGFSPEQRSEIKEAFRLLLNGGNREAALKEAETRTWGAAAALLVEAVRHPSKKGILTCVRHPEPPATNNR